MVGRLRRSGQGLAPQRKKSIAAQHLLSWTVLQAPGGSSFLHGSLKPCGAVSQEIFGPSGCGGDRRHERPDQLGPVLTPLKKSEGPPPAISFHRFGALNGAAGQIVDE
jgi:hypothetical protein